MINIIKWKRNHILLCAGLLLYFLAGIVSAFPQEVQPARKNYNRYYQFPLSIGAEYQMLTPFSEYGNSFNVFQASGIVRWPLPFLPILQVTGEGGIMQFDSLDTDNPTVWDHMHIYGGGGILFSHRFAKEFEIGLEAIGGYSQARFANLAPESGVVASPNWFVQAGGKLCINPSYNISIEVHPNVKYMGSLSLLKDFEGFIFGIGFGAHFRFGKDPDSPQAVIRDIKFKEAELPSLFAALQSYYTKEPIGSIILENTAKHSIKDVNISFFQSGYMDSPTPAATIETIEGGKETEVDLFASFNDEVFRIEGVTPLTGEIIVTYTSQGRAAEQRRSVTYDLHDKTALTWDDDRKVASFITPADSALRNYTSYIRQACKDELVAGFSRPLQEAMQVFEALNVLGCLYQVDPRNPFTEMQENPMIVDSVSLPRNTLKRITGDCDDLTVLYCSLLETIGITSGFITLPGHIYAVFNTEAQALDYEKVHPDRNMSINLDGELWVPVEITMIGKGSFLEAWRKGMEEYSQYDEQPEKRGVYITREAQQTYRPVGLKETDLGLQYGEEQQIVSRFQQDLGKLVDYVVSDYIEIAEERNNKKAYNRLGIAYAQFKQYLKAENAFKQALSLDDGYMSAAVNLGNISYLRGAYEQAVESFTTVLTGLEERGRADSSIGAKVLLNISKAYYAMEQFDEAKEYFEQAGAIDKALIEEHSYLASVSADTGERAAEIEETTVIFLEDEEAE